MGPQCFRVAKMLDRYPGGLTQVDFLAPNVIDGGAPITRLAARVHDLIHKHGQRIEVVGERHGCAVYARPITVSRPVPEPQPVVIPTDEEARLFSLAGNAIFGEAE